MALNRQTVVRLGRASWSFATSEVGGRAVALAGLLLALLLAINVLNVVSSRAGMLQSAVSGARPVSRAPAPPARDRSRTHTVAREMRQ